MRKNVIYSFSVGYVSISFDMWSGKNNCNLSLWFFASIACHFDFSSPPFYWWFKFTVRVFSVRFQAFWVTISPIFYRFWYHLPSIIILHIYCLGLTTVSVINVPWFTNLIKHKMTYHLNVRWFLPLLSVNSFLSFYIDVAVTIIVDCLIWNSVIIHLVLFIFKYYGFRCFLCIFWFLNRNRISDDCG